VTAAASEPSWGAKRLLLVGAGHGHVEILRRWIESPPAGAELAVVSLEGRQVYSGMTPGYLAGTYSLEEISFDVAALTELAGGELHVGEAVEVDTVGRRVLLAEGESVPYDLASFNLGSGTAGVDTPGVQEHASLVKPFGRVRKLHRRMREMAESGTGPASAVVVGAGAAGVELALALEAVLRRRGREPRVMILEATETPLAEYSPRFRRRAIRVLEGRGIGLRTRARVTAVEADAVFLEAGERLPSQLTLWLAGAAAPSIFERSKPATESRGFLLVDASLRSVSHGELFAVGDSATLQEFPKTPKAGVYAVREAPILWGSLMATLTGGTRPCFEPQKGFLSLVNTADGKALLRWKGLISHSRWAWWLKDWIDRGFMRRYQELTESRSPQAA
jgi:selenide, water dikinase